MADLPIQHNMEFDVLDCKKEPSDCEGEQTTAEGTLWEKPVGRRRHSVLVLSELDESEREGRVCRTLKYHPKLVQESDDPDLKAKNVFPLTADLIIKDAKETPVKKHVRKICGATREGRAELELHTEDHQLGRKDQRPKSGSGENRKGRGCVRETRTCPDLNPKSSHLANRQTCIPKDSKYVCNLCGVEYARKLNLVRHMRIHTGETPYTCETCGKGFRRTDWLAKHMNMHKDKSQASPDRRQKPYACEHCDKAYHKKSELKRHLLRHTGERPVWCAICEKRFYNVSSLNVHLQCHSDDRPHTCTECGHGFKRLWTLTKHMRIHTGEKPYSCGICGKRLSYKYSLTLHMRICS